MDNDNVVATNRQARREYFILETFEAGIELDGSEIKSIRKRRANLKDGFARIELFFYDRFDLFFLIAFAYLFDFFDVHHNRMFDKVGKLFHDVFDLPLIEELFLILF